MMAVSPQCDPTKDSHRMLNAGELKRRWKTDASLAAFRTRFLDAADAASALFLKRNLRLIRKSGRIRCQDWLKVFRPGMYKKMADMEDVLRDLPAAPGGDGEELRDMRGIDIDWKSFRGLALHRIDFFHAALPYPYDSYFYDCVFGNMEDFGATDGCYYEGCRFIDVEFLDVYTSKLLFERCSFLRVRIDSARPRGGPMSISHCVFKDCSFRKFPFELSRIANSVFVDCNFRRANFEDTQFENNMFFDCNFKNTEKGFVPPGVVVSR